MQKKLMRWFLFVHTSLLRVLSALHMKCVLSITKVFKSQDPQERCQGEGTGGGSYFARSPL